MRLNIEVAQVDFNYSEEDYDQWAENIKRQESVVFDRFKLATGRTMYRVGSDLFVDGVKV